MANQLPAGPARTRASDQDREQVVAFIRGHWSHGRLTDEELERRVGLALQARTLGDFRELCADLPPPPRSQSEVIRRRGAYLGRLWSPGGVGLLVVVAIFTLAVVGAVATQDEAAERTPVAAPPVETVPPDPDPTADAAPPPPEERTIRGAVGRPIVDGGLTIQVRSIRTPRSVPLRSDRGGGAIIPGPNRKFVVAEVVYVNRSRVPADPFCGSGSSELGIPAGESIRPVDNLYDIEGNGSICDGDEDGTPRGAAATNKLVFRVPTGDEPRWLEIWDGDEPGDSLGDTRIRIPL